MQEAGHATSQQLSQSQIQEISPSLHPHTVSILVLACSALVVPCTYKCLTEAGLTGRSMNPQLDKDGHVTHALNISHLWSRKLWGTSRGWGLQEKEGETQENRTERGRQGSSARNDRKCSETVRELKHSRVCHRGKGERKTEALT